MIAEFEYLKNKIEVSGEETRQSIYISTTSIIVISVTTMILTSAFLYNSFLKLEAKIDNIAPKFKELLHCNDGKINVLMSDYRMVDNYIVNNLTQQSFRYDRCFQHNQLTGDKE
jgi:hypothetical protein